MITCTMDLSQTQCGTFLAGTSRFFFLMLLSVPGCSDSWRGISWLHSLSSGFAEKNRGHLFGIKIQNVQQVLSRYSQLKLQEQWPISELCSSQRTNTQHQKGITELVGSVGLKTGGTCFCQHEWAVLESYSDILDIASKQSLICG